MFLSQSEKTSIKSEIAQLLSNEREVVRVTVFGSFVNSDDPEDVDIAVFQDSTLAYLPLALKYRRITRPLSRRIPLDILPLRAGSHQDPFLKEIAKGEVIYER